MDRIEGERRAARRPEDQPKLRTQAATPKRGRLGKDEQGSSARPAEGRGERSGLCEGEPQRDSPRPPGTGCALGTAQRRFPNPRPSKISLQVSGLSAYRCRARRRAARRYAGVPLPAASDLAEDQEVLLMLNSTEIMDTIHMIDQQHLDIRTITMGISLPEDLRQNLPPGRKAGVHRRGH